MQFEKSFECNSAGTTVECMTKRSIKNPSQCLDHNAGVALNTDNLAVATIEHLMNFDVGTKIRMPAIMDAVNLPDMGRMNGNWLWVGSRGYSPDRNVVGSGQHSCTR